MNTDGLKARVRVASVIVAVIGSVGFAQERSGALATFVAEAEALEPLTQSVAARVWLDQVEHLPEVPKRSIFYRRGNDGLEAFTAAQRDAMTGPDREGLREQTVDSDFYYSTRYGSPLVYTRAIDIATAAFGQEFSWSGTRVFDLGYGQIGQLRLMAMCGAEAVGLDVDPLLKAMYSEEGDTGVITGGAVGVRPAVFGQLRLVDGVWPGEPEARRAVGVGYDIVLARNVLKRGYIRPTSETPDWAKVDLGVSDEAVPRELFEITAPGGVVLIYNLGGRPAPERYNAATDIADPWSAAEWADAGFEIIVHDVDETEGVRSSAQALGWTEEPYNMDLSGLFGRYTLVRRPGG